MNGYSLTRTLFELVMRVVVLGSVLPIFAGFDAFPPKGSRKVDSCFEDDRNCLLQVVDTSRVVLFVAQRLCSLLSIWRGHCFTRNRHQQ
jgi:hypothetical protein